MTFLYGDYLVPPALKINANYYRWRFALSLGAVFAVAAMITSIVLHGLFALVTAFGGRSRHLPWV